LKGENKRGFLRSAIWDIVFGLSGFLVVLTVGFSLSKEGAVGLVFASFNLLLFSEYKAVSSLEGVGGEFLVGIKIDNYER
jgi:hypothetical protein